MMLPLWANASTARRHPIQSSMQSTKGKKALSATNAPSAHSILATNTDARTHSRPEETQSAATLADVRPRMSLMLCHHRKLARAVTNALSAHITKDSIRPGRRLSVNKLATMWNGFRRIEKAARVALYIVLPRGHT
jgi:hypothetical protein